MVESMITTTDNPFDPFTQFDEWYNFDTHAGYNSVQLLARIANNSLDLSDPDQDLGIEQAIDEMVRENVCGKFKKVSRETSNNSSSSG